MVIVRDVDAIVSAPVAVVTGRVMGWDEYTPYVFDVVGVTSIGRDTVVVDACAVAKMIPVPIGPDNAP
jgi:hypothetical protein